VAIAVARRARSPAASRTDLYRLLSLILIAVAATASQPDASPGQRSGLLLVTFPGAYTSILSFILGLGGLFAVIYGAAIAGSEWSWGTLKSAVARGESRSRYQLLSFAAIGLMIGIGMLIAFGAGIVVAVIGANIAGVSTEGLSDAETLGTIPELLGRGWLAIVEVGALGFAIATLAGASLAGIGAGIAFFFGEQFATLFLSDIVKYMPFNAANAVVATQGEGGFSGGGGGGPVISSLEPNQALLVVVAWLVGSLLVATLFTSGRDLG
jgi:ABC-type transport system involved in multi-copper enzyme maturation permease subunit